MRLDLLLKTALKFMISLEGSYSFKKQIRFKTSMLQSDLYDYTDPYIIVKRTTNVADTSNDAYDKNCILKIMLHASTASQK